MTAFPFARLPLIVAVPLAVVRVVERAVALSFAFIRDLMGLFAVEPMRLAMGGPSVPRSMGGHALALDVQQGLRHEAGVPRYSAARNT